MLFCDTSLGKPSRHRHHHFILRNLCISEKNHILIFKNILILILLIIASKEIFLGKTGYFDTAFISYNEKVSRKCRWLIFLRAQKNESLSESCHLGCPKAIFNDWLPIMANGARVAVTNFLHSSFISKFKLLVAGRMNKTAAKCFLVFSGGYYTHSKVL